MKDECDELFDLAVRNPVGMRFVELCELAECYGWTATRSRGSHLVFKRPGTLARMTFQRGNHGMAKAYQVRQLLKAIEEE